MTEKFLIDNPKVLEELQLTEPITVSGKYPVYENKQYKFIIIHE